MLDACMDLTFLATLRELNTIFQDERDFLIVANLNKNYQKAKNNPLGPRTILLDFHYVNVVPQNLPSHFINISPHKTL